MAEDYLETLLAKHLARYVDFYEQAEYPVVVYKANPLTNKVEPIEILQYRAAAPGKGLIQFMREGRLMWAGVVAFNLTKEEAEMELADEVRH